MTDPTAGLRRTIRWRDAMMSTVGCCWARRKRGRSWCRLLWYRPTTCSGGKPVPATRRRPLRFKLWCNALEGGVNSKFIDRPTGDVWKVEKLLWNNSHLHNYRGTISFFTNNNKTYLGLILVVKRPQPCFIRRKCRPHPWISQILKIFCSARWWVGVSAVKKFQFCCIWVA